MKSHEDDQVMLAICIYKDAVARCATIQPDKRDLMTIRSRVKDEGISFLTITLPAFCKDFERSLALGYVDSTFFQGFRKSGLIPAFLQGMISHIFDQVTGGLLDETDLLCSCVENVRQILLAFKKLELDCAPSRVRKSMDNFKQTERDLLLAVFQEEDISLFKKVSSYVWNCLGNVDVTDCIPKHGPGATEEHVSGNQKYVWRSWHDRLEPYFPLLGNAYPLGVYHSREFDDVTVVDEDGEQPVRVCAVPKTMKGPRLIAIEPCCMQYTQQGVRDVLYDIIEHSYFSRGHVNFTDQEINRKLALGSSKDGLMATLDLSDASDRVIYRLAISMFDGNPDLQDAIRACRSKRAKTLDGEVIHLTKFASMGSALCFPVESMYFYTICIVALLRERKLPVTSRNIYKVSRDVYVYGDDIIVPSTEVAAVVDHLQKYHCKVNMTKSFWTGKFRESCGMDAFDGRCVTPTYIRQVRPNNRRQASKVVSWIKTANLFEKRGFSLTSAYMFNVCERLLGRLPVVSERSSALGRITVDGLVTAGRWNKYLQRSEIRAWVTEPVRCTDELAGYGALTKSLLSLNRKPLESKCFDEDAPIIDKKHLERSARHGAVALKRRWVSIT